MPKPLTTKTNKAEWVVSTTDRVEVVFGAGGSRCARRPDVWCRSMPLAVQVAS